MVDDHDRRAILVMLHRYGTTQRYIAVMLTVLVVIRVLDVLGVT
jgi:hypothetical protein